MSVLPPNARTRVFALLPNTQRTRCAKRLPQSRSRSLLASSSNGATATAADSATANGVPTPVVKIDNISDPFATLVSVEFGDRLGELLDTVRGSCCCFVVVC
jgi:hypothetical protein